MLFISCRAILENTEGQLSEFIPRPFPLFSYKSIFSPDFNKAKGKNGSSLPSFPAPAPVQVTHTVSIFHQKGMTSNKWDSNNTFWNTVNCLCLLSLSLSFSLCLSLLVTWFVFQPIIIWAELQLKPNKFVLLNKNQFYLIKTRTKHSFIYLEKTFSEVVPLFWVCLLHQNQGLIFQRNNIIQ